MFVPRIVNFVNGQLNKPEYRVDSLPVYIIDEYNISEKVFEENRAPGGHESEFTVSGNTVSDNSVSDNSVSGNTVSGNVEVSSDNVTVSPYKEVSPEYFNDALFIGDSRTVGLKEYSDMTGATYYAATGLTIHKVLDSKIVESDSGEGKISVDEALGQRRFGKIYLMLGINEMGSGNVDTFMGKYADVVARIRELQPQAVIYLQGIMKVSEEYSGLSDYIHNQGIVERNERIATLADNDQIFYLDVNPLVCDENGGLKKEYSYDGVHLKAEYIHVWTDFLLSHGIIRDY